MTLLRIESLRTYFHTRRGIVKAVNGVDLTVGAGEAVGLVGESGAGKSTIAFSILRLIQKPGKIEGGKIMYKEHNLLALGEAQMRHIRGKEISMVFQDPMTYLNPVLTNGEQIAEVIRLHQIPGNAKLKVMQALEQVRIPDPERIMKSYPHQISGGMKQRVLIAMAIACYPSLLIADEPTTALDVTVQAQILRLIRNIKDQLNVGLLLITHDLGIVAEICDRVYVMYAGKVMEHARVFDLFEGPKHPYTVGLLKSVLSINEFKENLVGIPGKVPDLVEPPAGCLFHPRCPEALPKCKVDLPPKFNLGDGRYVYCWLYE